MRGGCNPRRVYLRLLEEVEHLILLRNSSRMRSASRVMPAAK
jgi:hypothetical protein